MGKNQNPTTIGNYIIKILKINIVLGISILILSILFGFDFSFCYFVAGLLIAVAGSYLGGPSEREDYSLGITNHPNKAYSKRLFSMLEKRVPSFGFENTLFYSGLVALILSLPFLCQIMFFDY